MNDDTTIHPPPIKEVVEKRVRTCWRCKTVIVEGEGDGTAYASYPPQHAHAKCPQQAESIIESLPSGEDILYGEFNHGSMDEMGCGHTPTNLTTNDLKSLVAQLTASKEREHRLVAERASLAEFIKKAFDGPSDNDNLVHALRMVYNALKGE